MVDDVSIVIEKSPRRILWALYEAEASGTYLWGQTAWQVFGRTKGKDVVIAYYKGLAQGGVIVDIGQSDKGLIFSIFTTKGFNPKLWLRVWKFLQDVYLEKAIGVQRRVFKGGLEIPNPRLQAMALRFGFTRKNNGRFVPPLKRKRKKYVKSESSENSAS